MKAGQATSIDMSIIHADNTKNNICTFEFTYASLSKYKSYNVFFILLETLSMSLTSFYQKTVDMLP